MQVSGADPLHRPPPAILCGILRSPDTNPAESAGTQYPAVGARPSVSPHYLHFLGSVTGLGSIQRAVLKKLTSAANSPLVSKLVLAEQDQAHDRNKAIRFVKPLRP